MSLKNEDIMNGNNYEEELCESRILSDMDDFLSTIRSHELHEYYIYNVDGSLDKFHRGFTLACKLMKEYLDEKMAEVKDSSVCEIAQE